MLTSDPRLSVPVETLIPHRKPMCLIDRLIEFKDQGGTVEASVPFDHALVDGDGRLDTLAVAEMIAQSYAAVKGYDDRRTGEPVKQGFLVGIRKIQFLSAVFAGDLLRINVKTVGSIAGFAVVAGTVRRHQELLAEGEIKLWIQDDDQAEATRQ
jgi:predicted hotdog family 3-hydroxylacyl-ACP dehydratase